ncbi:MAG TPA: sugar phosphate isomerase/epimerase family protein [Armatimonadota bacterium]|nr:sugar phosphate isomerase/epimerase family protein [Armatimonadota bacterium]
MTRATRYKIGSGFAPFSPCAERFVVGGYRDPMSLEQQIGLATRVEGLRGVGLDYPYQFGDGDIERVRRLLSASGFEFCTLEIGLYPDRKWKLGTFTAPDPGIRREAIEMCKRGLEVAADLGAADVLLWPGQDGFDYPFQVDYDECWRALVEGIGEVAAHRPEVKVAIEYKPKEPRANIFVRNAGTLLYLINSIGLPNVGATIDFGHSLVAGENAAEAAVLLAREGKLFQVHVNDNYRDWDHDLIVGAVSLWETVEFCYWILKSGYEGWYVIDVYPYREDGLAALQQCVRNWEKVLDMAGTLTRTNIAEAMSNADAVSSVRTLWDTLLP